jgi:hypothetical protein
MAMRDRDLAQAEQLIAECKNRIARQREVIANAFQTGHDTEVAISLLRAFEASLQAFEKHRQLVRARQKERSGYDRQEPVRFGSSIGIRVARNSPVRQRPKWISVIDTTFLSRRPPAHRQIPEGSGSGP